MSQMCQPHWEKLKDAIKARGLYRFTAADGATLVEQVTRPDARASFEPLMGAHLAILQNALAVNLSAVLGEGCPLCFLIENCACGKPDCRAKLEDWPNRAAEDQLERARALGILP